MTIIDLRDRENNGLDESVYRTIDFIVIDELREFALTGLERFGTTKKLEEANRVADVLRDLLVHKNLLDEHTHQSFVDILMVSALLHNLFYDEKDWTTLFHARRELEPIAEEVGINAQSNKQSLDALYHTIEGQLGDQTPVTECIPKPATPTELFSYAVWFAKQSNAQ
ncbi:hypothetical protein [Bacillus atrophaeus]|uniref:hypothetical protein n=1 Tax=Bacillus atrophaeus TaxID=1452 RepID=UPI002E1D7BC4|nr:hypothetical protein [Bacillus atrophaeus]